MSPLETLFQLELDYHRRVRALALGMSDSDSLHTSYAIRFGYEHLLNSAGIVSIRDVEALTERAAQKSDTRDVRNAFVSLQTLLGVRLVER